MHAFILAGGFATRLWPLTERRAKPLLPIAGKPLLSWMIDAIPAGLPITVSTNAAFADDFTVWQRTQSRPITIMIEDAGHDDQKLGALGAFAHWIKTQNIDDDVVLLAGDNFADFSLLALYEAFREHPIVAGYDIGSKEAARRFGTIVLDGNRVVSFEEKPQNPRSSIVSTGWSILPRAALPIVIEYAQRKPDDIGGIFEELLRRGHEIDCTVFHGLWKDIGSFEAYLALHRHIVAGRNIVHASATVDEASVLTGSVDIGARCIVRHSRITDCILFDDCVLENCVLERCILDAHCNLRGVDLAEKMLRAGTTLQKKQP